MLHIYKVHILFRAKKADLRAHTALQVRLCGKKYGWGWPVPYTRELWRYAAMGMIPILWRRTAGW